MLSYPKIDPVIVQIGPLAIRWYSLAYIAGILLGCAYVKWLNNKMNLIKNFDPFDDVMVWAIIGIVIGGRLGYVLFYQPGYYLFHPFDIIKIWQGGMSFHGGMLGVLGTFYLLSKKKNYPFLTVMDYACAASPIGLFFGRIANFINGELYGRVADVPWAMVFPGAGSLPRHPSQLYEAGLEGLLLFVVIAVLVQSTSILKKPGCVSGVFLCGYGASRLCIELFREPDDHLGLFFGHISMGQLLSVPMVIGGIAIIYYCWNIKRNKS